VATVYSVGDFLSRVGVSRGECANQKSMARPAIISVYAAGKVRRNRSMMAALLSWGDRPTTWMFSLRRRAISRWIVAAGAPDRKLDCQDNCAFRDERYCGGRATDGGVRRLRAFVDDTNRFKSAKELCGHVGLAPWVLLHRCLYGGAHCGTEQDRSARRAFIQSAFDTAFLRNCRLNLGHRDLILYSRKEDNGICTAPASSDPQEALRHRRQVNGLAPAILESSIKKQTAQHRACPFASSGHLKGQGGITTLKSRHLLSPCYDDRDWAAWACAIARSAPLEFPVPVGEVRQVEP